MTISKLAAALTALLALSACATQPEIPYDRNAEQSNKTIGLLTPGWPSGPTSFLASEPGQSFGLVGALIDAARQSNRDKDLEKIIAAHNLDLRAQFVTRLSANLESKGYKVVAVSADATRSSFAKKYPGAAEGIDSYLDVAVPIYGYMAAGIGADSPYRPWFAAGAKLVRANDAHVLMQDRVVYNTIGEAKNVITLSPDPQYAFPKWNDVEAAPDRAVAGMQDAADKSADTIANLLK